MRNSLPALVLVSSVAVAVFVTGRYYDSRHAAEIARLEADAAAAAQRAAEQARRAEQAKIEVLENERANHLAALQITEAALADTRSESERLRGIVAAGRRRAAARASAAGGDHAAAETSWVVLDECLREYAQMARDADALNNLARLAAGYARAVMAE